MAPISLNLCTKNLSLASYWHIASTPLMLHQWPRSAVTHLLDLTDHRPLAGNRSSRLVRVTHQVPLAPGPLAHPVVKYYLLLCLLPVTAPSACLIIQVSHLFYPRVLFLHNASQYNPLHLTSHCWSMSSEDRNSLFCVCLLSYSQAPSILHKCLFNKYINCFTFWDYF